MKTAELEGALLDYWVAKATGMPLYECGTDAWPGNGKVFREGFEHPILTVGLMGIQGGVFIEQSGEAEAWRPSQDWADGGPIIDREKIVTDFDDRLWGAAIRKPGSLEHMSCGPTPLIAAMRAYVASKFGDTVPDEQAA